MDAYLSPLPTDLALLSGKASATASLGLDTVDSIIARLELARSQLSSPALSEGNPGDTLLPLSSFVKTGNINVANSHKEWSSAVGKFSKAVDKKFTGPPLPLFPAPSPPTPPPANLDPSLLYLTTSSTTPTPSATSHLHLPSTFSSPHAISSLNHTIALHLARLGAFASLETFLQESGTPQLDHELLEKLKELHAILADLRRGVCTSALEWVEQHPGVEGSREDDLEFALRKEEYCRILLGGSDTSASASLGEREPLLSSSSSKSTSSETTPTPDRWVQLALAYGGHHFRSLLTPARKDLISALLTSPLYMPLPRLLHSPYAHLFAQYVGAPSPSNLPGEEVVVGGATESNPLCASFAAAFLRLLELPKDSPLSVVTDIGGGGAMAKIQKVRMVMKEKKTEWSAVGELPVEIPLPTTRRYHSIFACPVSKEQSTSTNPPMLLPCGHVIAKESLARLARGTPQLKCPYCPVVSRVSDSVRVYF